MFEKEGICPDCGHSLKDNMHGPDQNDYTYRNGKWVHLGYCTYCKECRKILLESRKKEVSDGM